MFTTIVVIMIMIVMMGADTDDCVDDRGDNEWGRYHPMQIVMVIMMIATIMIAPIGLR